MYKSTNKKDLSHGTMLFCFVCKPKDANVSCKFSMSIHVIHMQFDEIIQKISTSRNPIFPCNFSILNKFVYYLKLDIESDDAAFFQSSFTPSKLRGYILKTRNFYEACQIDVILSHIFHYFKTVDSI